MLSTNDLPKALRDSRALSVLERSLEKGRLGHGILLHGESMAALESVACVIAAQLLGSANHPLEHPDCFTLRPQGKARMINIGSEAKRQGGDWPLNSMRRLIVDLQKTPSMGSRKVAIVFEADRMNAASANAFLKTLEEPAPGTTLFLLSTRPYSLLDTIRSRCLNFRIPAAADVIADPQWEQWLDQYCNWMQQLADGPRGKEAISDCVFGAYGLNTGFQAILARQTDAEWAERKQQLTDAITDEQKSAIESGIRKGLRKQLYASIEKATVQFSRDYARRNGGQMPIAATARAIEALEHAARLLELNFNEAAALELFLLKSLRIWVTSR